MNRPRNAVPILLLMLLLGIGASFVATTEAAPLSHDGHGHHNTTTTTTAPTTTTTTTPPVTCSTGQLSCGNNAATQIAIVSQNCENLAVNTVQVAIEAPNGSPQGTYTINPQTCINISQITQVVQQFCINCTIVVVPPAAAPAAAPQAQVAPQRAFYCMPAPILRDDGTYGRFVDLVLGQPSTDPHYAGATPAPFDLGQGGYYCPSSSSSPATVAASLTPTFTLTVPASFVGQVLRLCLQGPNASVAPVCHDIAIDQGATVSVPVTSSVAATIQAGTGKTKSVNPKASAAALAAATSRLSKLHGKAPTCPAKPAKTTKKTTLIKAGKKPAQSCTAKRKSVKK